MSISNYHNAELLFDAKSILGEGPVWDWRNQRLYWVDIEGKRLHQHDPSNGKNSQWEFDHMVGAAVPKQDGNMLLALENGMATFDFKSQTLTWHKVLENTDTMMRYNDGKVGPDNSFWIGSMHKKFAPGKGNLYKLTKDFGVSVQIPKTTISNGMAWTADNRIFYYIDSPTFQVYSFDFEVHKGKLSNKKSILKIPKAYGSPDGMSIDSEGMLWIAHWGGSCVRCWNPNAGEVIHTVKVDAPHVTSCCFGGNDLDTLYITTARSGLGKARLEKYPYSGGLFAYRPQTKGTPINYF